VSDLRKLIEFLPTEKPFIGFGEHHPADGNTADAAASQANRRVELLFFEYGQEPDVAILDEAPEITELYSDDAFVREEIGERPGGAKRHFSYELAIERRTVGAKDVSVRVFTEDGSYDQRLPVQRPFDEPGLLSATFFDLPHTACISVVRYDGKNQLIIHKNKPVSHLMTDEASIKQDEGCVVAWGEPNLQVLKLDLEEDCYG
jgi:hypothetical protein